MGERAFDLSRKQSSVSPLLVKGGSVELPFVGFSLQLLVQGSGERNKRGVQEVHGRLGPENNSIRGSGGGKIRSGLKSFLLKC